jgi:pyruvate,orthophosphate dikinase
MPKKWVYRFGSGKTEGSAHLRNLLGGKGANLAEMTQLGIPVPPGFTISTQACLSYFETAPAFPPGLEAQVKRGIRFLEQVTGKRFGSPTNPLLVSVRSGAPVSMPGMMDTILNLGIHAQAAEALATLTQNPFFAYDSYRRFLQMYANVVLGVPSSLLEEPLKRKKEERGVAHDSQLSPDDLKEVISKIQEILKEKGKEVPEDPWDQLWGAIRAVFLSWRNSRAIEYRKLHGIPENLGTAVNVQVMVFGNMGNDSGTGVAFTRNPSTGEKEIYGEFLLNAQGEDVVAGIRTPGPIRRDPSRPGQSLEELLPDVYQQLTQVFDLLERHYRDMQDVEFTVERGKLYILQTRSGKRSIQAGVKIAVDLYREGLISEKEALLLVEADKLDQLLHPTLDPSAPKQELAVGLPASPGAAQGLIAFTPEEAVERSRAGFKVILVRDETSPEDIVGMSVSEGILTARGGMTSHAAVVARGMGKPAVTGCGALIIDEHHKKILVNGYELGPDSWITIDGSTGKVYLGKVPTKEPELSEEFSTLLQWADRYRRLKVRTNADTPRDAEIARRYGAEGIGLCRTEHMFFAPERILAVREMILAESKEERERALKKILPMQRQDFYEILKVMEELPVTIRLLDPPLHEFLPKTPEEFKELAQATGLSEEVIRIRAHALQEFNPMLGHRGCRLGITFPEIYQMQVRAIYEAACDLKKEGKEVYPEVMIPLVADPKELKLLRQILVAEAEKVMQEKGVLIPISFGTMIELPRAALLAGEIAKIADFFSFGTNDLTQMTWGLSRDDSGRFLPHYLNTRLLETDPFMTLDPLGVGRLMRMAVEEGKKEKRELKTGICGEHGGDPRSIEFCESIGLDYVSASPFRVIVARLASAQARIRREEEKTTRKSRKPSLQKSYADLGMKD